MGFTCLGTGVTFGPPLAGWMFDMRGDYYMSFAFAAVMMWLFLKCWHCSSGWTGHWLDNPRSRLAIARKFDASFMQQLGKQLI